MARVLLVTVGGSPEPILQAVQAHQPDEVVFICSAPPCAAPSLDQVIGEGTPCRHLTPGGADEWRPNLVQQLQLPDFRPDLQLIALPDPDDLAAIHSRILQACEGLSDRFSRLELLGDYSGGTKAMSAALAMALVDQNAQLSLVAGNRRNLIRIERSEGIRPMAVSTIRVGRLLREQLPPLLERHLYDQAYLLLQELRLLQADSLDQASLEAIDHLKQHLAVLMRWDRFEWDGALSDASRLDPQQHPEALLLWWKRVVAAQTMLHGEQGAVACTGYELVQDLLLNAERRGRRGWYDDAVARLYRALELLAQTYIQLELRYHHQDFWDDPDIQRECRQWRVRRGVGGLFWWLKHREGGTGLGGAASRQWPVLQQLLDARNHSLLGHGLQPVLQRDWRSLQDRVANLVATALREAGCSQGAPPEQLPGVALLQQPAVSVLTGET